MSIRPEHRQRGHRVRLEWGRAGAALLAAECAAVVVVDVLSFCTAVDVAVGRGAEVLPQRSDDAAAAAREATARGAVPAGDRHGPGPSLRPSSLVGIAAGTLLATGASVLSFQWQSNGVNLADGGHFSGVTTSNLAVANADASVVANYRC
ncbi:MAG: hypothetical protein NTW05_04185, partial [Pseudonocardiales bacterium]|nr:hypothetical protein [Pseudonocardiales bacterium]